MDPLLLDIPEELTTERLILRVPQPGWGAQINAATVDAVEELRPWMPWANPTPTIETSELFVRRSRANFHLRKELNYTIFLRADNTVAGGCGFHEIDWDISKFEIGYWLRTRLVGQGYMTEAVRALTRLAFEQLKANRVQITMDDRNTRSWRVAERCGYTLEGTLRNECRAPDGRLRDTRMYARVSAG